MNKNYANNIVSFAGQAKLLLFSVIFLGLAIVGANAQTVLVNYAFNDAVAGTPCNAGTSNVTGGVTATFTTSTGACTTPAGAATTAAAFMPNAAGPAVSITGFATGNTQYFQLQLSNVAVFQNYQIYLQALRSNTGPATGDLQYSTDGVNFTSFQTVAIPTAAPAAAVIDLSGVTAINNQPNVYFRIVGSGGTAAGGTFRIDNLQVQALRPTAANANISGRVTTAGGRGIANAVLMISGNSLSEPSYVRTNSFGNYKFINLPAGETFVISVTAKNYTFDNPSRVVSLQSDLIGADFASNR